MKILSPNFCFLFENPFYCSRKANFSPLWHVWSERRKMFWNGDDLLPLGKLLLTLSSFWLPIDMLLPHQTNLQPNIDRQTNFEDQMAQDTKWNQRKIVKLVGNFLWVLDFLSTASTIVFHQIEQLDFCCCCCCCYCCFSVKRDIFYAENYNSISSTQFIHLIYQAY